MNDYLPIPTTVAAAIAQQFAKNVVVIVALDVPHDRTHYTTFGVSPEEKAIAANMSDLIAGVLSEGRKVEVFEDFRDLDAAQAKAQIDDLKAQVYAPGIWECPQCGFTWQKNILSPAGCFADARVNLEPCPNDGRDMVPVTWKKLSQDNYDASLRLLDEKEVLKKLCLAAAHTLKSLVAVRTGIPDERLYELAAQLENPPAKL